MNNPSYQNHTEGLNPEPAQPLTEEEIQKLRGMREVKSKQDDLYLSSVSRRLACERETTEALANEEAALKGLKAVIEEMHPLVSRMSARIL